MRPPSPPSESPELGPRLVQCGATLLHAQCWLWGQDLASPQGNLLQRAGLDRGVFEGARSHRTYYRATLEGSRFAVAWSGGLLFGDGRDALFFPRLRFAPVALDVPPGCFPDLNALGVAEPSSLHRHHVELVIAALQWLAGYEDVVRLLAGADWRRECARRWMEIEDGAAMAAASVGATYERLPPLPGDGLTAPWRELAHAVADCVM